MPTTFTEPITKTPTSRGVTATDWNTYIKANLTALYEHQAETSAIHGLAAGVNPIGCATDDGVMIQGTAIEATTGGTGGVRWTYNTWTFAKPYTVNPKVFMDCITSGGENRGWCRVTSVDLTGCVLAWGTVNSGVTGQVQGIACGYTDQSDSSPYAWYAPRTWADGELLPYSAWNSEVRDDVNYLRHRHMLLDNHVHGLGPKVYVLGGQASGKQLDFQRYPLGDKDTQTESRVECNHSFAFTRAFSSEPAVVLAAEIGPPPMGEHLYCEIQTLTTTGFDGKFDVGTDSGAPWYVEFLAVGAA